ncbi:asparagine synthase (glutamine-hydrolyzing) [Caloramator proteoclasticus]|uniref:asparagine synthase (glutamine-hydrolyzing) n=1 Tax=Caloramator proteoclasticus DSM 10124 TaxID=1121262 RepID=A0A1M4VAR6_9CLOT|nr:asparagine synthase (glutamine-hydrolyzing) [Caloramator proteoclasticus]SHE66064.1 asparagine synthase (glutamine-hydrolysing) [Caloramator proteoclasticus DSM 10124]
MCGIVGWINFDENIKDRMNEVERMTRKLIKRGPDEEGFYQGSNVLFGHRRLVVVDPVGGQQPMIKEFGGNRYILVYNGELYNTNELRDELKKLGYTFNSYSDTEVLLTAYVHYKEDCINHLNGIFAFAVWDENKSRLFMARDHLGVKPLFYFKQNNEIIFASEIKSILSHSKIKPILDKDGLETLFALGPSRPLGDGILKGIKEVPPASYLIFENGNFIIKEYWKPTAYKNNQTLDECIDNVRSLVIDAIYRQLSADVKVCTFLSGGLDSSIISYVASNFFKEKGMQLETFSIDYEDNEKYFKANDYIPNNDNEYIDLMVSEIESIHKNVVLSQEQLVNYLEEAVLANDLPGMADIDSSLYLFCREIRKYATVALSGECADEVFGGYPWYIKREDLNYKGFPWLKSVDVRKSIINKNLKLDLESKIKRHYEETINQVEYLDEDDELTKRLREMFYLNIKWFMVTLLNRKDRMSMSNSLEVRVPFADYRLVEFAYNIPPKFKFCDGREKGILRRALKGILPDDIIERKKSPYPKTHNPKYTELVCKYMIDILSNKNEPILYIIDKDFVEYTANIGAKNINDNWFGQLMSGPQTLAYLIQVNTWLKKYNIDMDFK